MATKKNDSVEPTKTGPRFKGPDDGYAEQVTTSAALEAFRKAAKTQAERIPSATLVLDVGQEVGGVVLRTGIYRPRSPKLQPAPIVVLDPAECYTTVPVANDGTTVAELPTGTAYVIVGLGTVLTNQLSKVAPGDIVHIERLEDVDHHPDDPAMDPYRCYETMVMRRGRMHRAVDLPALDLSADAGVDVRVGDEEPF